LLFFCRVSKIGRGLTTGGQREFNDPFEKWRRFSSGDDDAKDYSGGFKDV